MKFQAERGGYRLRSYRLAPANVPLPAGLTNQLRALAQAMIDESLPRPTRHRGKRGTLSWTPGNDGMKIRY